MTSILRRMGLYRALNASAVQFNSIVFRVVVGFLAGVPGEIVALIPAIEFFLNFLLEIPSGYLADRYGRIPFAIAPAATRAAVSLADDRPPPAWSRMPYLLVYVKSACDGRNTSAIWS